MKKKIQSYLVFTTAGYQLFIFALIPLLSIGVVWLVERMQNWYVGVLCMLCCYCCFEIIADIRTFGGLFSKRGGLPEYCKTSRWGTQLLLDALTANMTRQLLTEFVLVLLIRVGYAIKGQSPQWNGITCLLVICEVLLTYIFIQVGIMVTRFFGTLYTQMIIATIATLGLGLSTILIQIGYLFALVILIAAVVLVSLGCIIFVKKKGEQSYYDKRY